MSYQILAQKYRPQVFDDVVGQETITKTLKNSILKERTANAYLFCGPRGVGKTSVARILSKTLNCESDKDDKPCNKCLSCKEVTSGNNIDVLEIDGASNNSVEEIRALRENVKFSPSKGKFKIYIIDEVHMLSQGAFNALLKTLEEPPAHVKFMFATTEAHKVIPTITSRCQRFDFKRISTKSIVERLNKIAKNEKIEIEEKAVLLIARSSDGSLRDALVMLDQMISFSGGKIVFDDVVELLGVIHSDKIFEMSEALIDGDTKCVIETLEEMINNGKDPIFIVNCLISHYRDLMIFKTISRPTADMVFSSSETEKIESMIKKISVEENLYILQNLSFCLNLMKSVVFSRALLEISLVKITKRGVMVSLENIIDKIENSIDLSPESNLGGSINSFPTGSLDNKNKDVRKNNSKENNSVEDKQADDFSDTDNDNDGMVLPDENTMKFNWRAILNDVKSKKMSVFTFLSSAKPVSVNRDGVVVGFSKDHAFHKEVLETAENKDIVEASVRKIMGESSNIKFTLLEFLGDSQEQSEDAAKKRTQARENMKPFVEKAMDVFGGHVIRETQEDDE